MPTIEYIQLFCNCLNKTVDVSKIHLFKQNNTHAARGAYIDKDVFKCHEAEQCQSSDCNQIKDDGINYLQKV